jgi:hypothetical protein
LILALESKFVPVTFSGKDAPPTVTEVGSVLLMVGLPRLTVKLLAVLVPTVVVTVMLAVTGEAIRLAGTAAETCAALTKVVVNAVLFQFTTALESKFVPLTVSVVKDESPELALVGLNPLMVGVSSLMAKLLAVLAPPVPETVTLTVPAEATKLAEIAV